MATSRVAVDLLNPGQVFACLGLMEATEQLSGPCEGRSEYSAGETDAVFVLNADKVDAPLAVVLHFLRGAHVEALAPHKSGMKVQEAGVPTAERQDELFPSEGPDAPAALPIRVVNGSARLRIEHWADGSSRDNVKFWAGAGGYSGAALARDALAAVAGWNANEWRQALVDPFNAEVAMSSSFRFDWRRDYVPLDLGFSLNQQPRITAVGFPLVELLAAIGLEHSRPVRVNRWDKLEYRYGAWTEMLPTTLARAALGAPSSFPFPIRRYRMRLGWPGQEGQARCIVDAHEE